MPAAGGWRRSCKGSGLQPAGGGAEWPAGEHEMQRRVEREKSTGWRVAAGCSGMAAAAAALRQQQAGGGQCTPSTLLLVQNFVLNF